MELKEPPLIYVKNIDEERRPRLADMLFLAEGSAYLLSPEEEPGEDDRLLILIKNEETMGLIDDHPASRDGTTEERFFAIPLEGGAIDKLRFLLGVNMKIRKESTGRPPKYNINQEGADIFIKHVYEGHSIKAIAKAHKMSPTTVQKLLNKSRFKAADNFIEGVWSLSKESLHWEKNLSVLEWVIEHSKGERKKRYEEFLATLMTG